MTDTACTPRIFIIEDEDGLRDARLRYFNESLSIPAVGYASGEAFLNDLTVATRGVVSLDINLKNGGGRLDGCQVFERMLHLGSHMPVSFLTGPFAEHLRLCIDMVTRRPHVNYFGKGEPVRLVNEQLIAYLKDEPALYEKAERERWLLNLICVDMTHAEREALDGTYQGKTAAQWAEEIGASYRILQQQSANGQRRFTGMHKLTGANLDAIDLVREVAPLMERLKCKSLQDMAAKELARRLTLMDRTQQQAVHRVLSKAAELGQDPQAQQALTLMRLDDMVTLRALLKNASSNLQGLMLPRLPEESHGLVRHWLEWAGGQGTSIAWEKLSAAG